MKSYYFSIYAFIAALALGSCSKGDPFSGEPEVFDAPVFSDATPVDARIKALYNTYNVHFRPQFELGDYTFNWEQSVKQTGPEETGVRYTPADPNYAIEVMDSVENWVFKIFPLDFSKKYMPLNILMADTMESKYLSGVNLVHRLYEGYIATNYTLITTVSPRFNSHKATRPLREAWLSLFVEKMYPRLPAPPAEFTSISKAGYDKLTYTNAEDVMVNYALLKKGRTKQNSGSATAAWNKTSVAQDFGDYVAFIVYTPDSEKQLVYAKNAGIQLKVNLMKTYFHDKFGITLPYLPIAP